MLSIVKNLHIDGGPVIFETVFTIGKKVLRRNWKAKKTFDLNIGRVCFPGLDSRRNSPVLAQNARPSVRQEEKNYGLL
jgi:hypothetical protein